MAKDELQADVKISGIKFIDAVGEDGKKVTIKSQAIMLLLKIERKNRFYRKNSVQVPADFPKDVFCTKAPSLPPL